jgi:CheY-like chemotaxis protein
MPRGHQELILLVEDNADVLQITTSMLKYLGYRVLTARNGQEALHLYGQYQPEIALVLTDMTMPEMGGAELTQALQQRNPGLKVVVLTGYPLGPKTKNPLPAGITNWLQKPPKLEYLARVVNESLG